MEYEGKLYGRVGRKYFETGMTTSDVSEKKAEPVVKLTAYEWHFLLNEMQHLMRICNRDNTNTEQLYRNIANQLNEVQL